MEPPQNDPHPYIGETWGLLGGSIFGSFKGYQIGISRYGVWFQGLGFRSGLA